MRYFEHDTAAMDDERIAKLYIEFGYEGVGLFYATLERLAKQEKPINTDVLKKQLRVGKKLEKCWNFMESLELLSSNNGETFNKRLANFIQNYKEKNKKTAERVSKHRDNQTSTENVTQLLHECNAIEENRIEENIKEEVKNKPAKAVSSIQSFLNDLPEAERAICERFIKYRREIKKVVHTTKVLVLFLNQLKDKTTNPELWPAAMDILESKQWVSIEHVKLEDIPSTEPIPLGYRLAAMRCGAKTDDQIRKIIPKFEGLNPDFVGLWFWHNKVVPDAENIRTLPNWIRDMKVEKNEIRKVYAKHKSEGVKAILEKSIEWTKTKL